MPIFGYQCPQCGQEYQLWEPCKEEGDKPFCPHCGAAKPEEFKYRLCRYWLQMIGSPKSQHIRPGSWA